MKKFIRFFTVAEDSDQIINVSTLFLAMFGLVMAVSASMTASDNSTRLLLVATMRQLVFFVISYFMMVFLSKIFNYRLAHNLIMPTALLMIGLLLLTLVFEPIGGAKAWLHFNFGPLRFTLQPAEFAKVVNIILVAMFFGDISYNTKRSTSDIIKPVITIVIVQVIIIIFFQNDLGSALVLALLALFVALIPSHPRIRKVQNWAIILIVLGFILSFLFLTDTGINLILKTKLLQPYQLKRFINYTNPFKNLQDGGYQLAGSLVAFSRGNWFGIGLGQSIQKYGYLPEARTDFILSVIAEELGFVGVMVLLIVYAILIWRLLYYALKMKSEKDKMILTGTVIYLFLHILLNIGGVSVSIPLTGVPLLLISSGGSSTMATMAIIGVCQSIISKYRKGVINENRQRRV